MKNLRRTFTVLFAAAFSMQVLAQREDKLINQDWSFRFSHQVNASAARRVDLPHTWNAQDALGGKHDYKRGIGNYTKKIFIRPEWHLLTIRWYPHPFLIHRNYLRLQKS